MKKIKQFSELNENQLLELVEQEGLKVQDGYVVKDLISELSAT